MTSAKGSWSWGKRMFLPLVGLGMVGIFSFVALAQEPPAAGPQENQPPGKVERAGQAVGKGVERGATATGQGLKRAVNATERGLKRAGNATARGIKRAGEAVEKAFSGKD